MKVIVADNEKYIRMPKKVKRSSEKKKITVQMGYTSIHRDLDYIHILSLF